MENAVSNMRIRKFDIFGPQTDIMQIDRFLYRFSCKFDLVFKVWSLKWIVLLFIYFFFFVILSDWLTDNLRVEYTIYHRFKLQVSKLLIFDKVLICVKVLITFFVSNNVIFWNWNELFYINIEWVIKN